MKPETPSARKRREKKSKLTWEGILIDPLKWTEQDWRELHEAIKAAIEKIAARHKGKSNG